jgi:hypothetical protein
MMTTPTLVDAPSAGDEMASDFFMISIDSAERLLGCDVLTFPGATKLSARMTLDQSAPAVERAKA